MTSFIIKIIACFTMILDHIKYAIPALDNEITLYLGRISYPLFAFLLVEGYIHTSDLKKYCKRLFIFALISQIPFMLFRTLVGEWKMMNIMFTLLFGIACISVYDKIENKYISIPICILLILLGDYVNVDYGWFGITMMLLLYIFREDKFLKIVAYIALILFYFYTLNINYISKEIVVYFFAYILPLIPICLYNGNQGKKMKYFFYFFYPIHMIVLYGLSFLFI